MTSLWALLNGNRNYRYTWMGQVVSETGDWFNNIAVFALVMEKSGSGVVVSPDGYILTNHHVVEGVREILVTMADSERYVAKLVARDMETDLAVIKVDAPNPLTVMPIGTSSDLMPGETVIATHPQLVPNAESPTLRGRCIAITDCRIGQLRGGKHQPMDGKWNISFDGLA